jgi:hypothetical protein
MIVYIGITYSSEFPLFYIEQGLKTNKERYIKYILEDVVVLRSQLHFQNEGWTFEQNSPPVHRVNLTQAYCATDFADNITYSESKEWFVDDFSNFIQILCHNILLEHSRLFPIFWENI